MTRSGFVAAIIAVAATFSISAPAQQAHAEVQSWMGRKLPDQRGEFVRLCAPHMVGRWEHPESICICLHDHAVASVDDADLREALLRGISERGVPTIENAWVPASKQPLINAAFTQIARPTLQCMFSPVG